MLTIFFTQCDPTFALCERSRAAMLKPVELRIEYYQNQLVTHPEGRVWYSVDELLILYVQYLVRHKILKHNEVVFYSLCEDDHLTRELHLDEDGDFLEEMHHGFFSQRLELLR